MTTPKNGKMRTITAAPTVMELLKAQRAKQVLMRIDAGQKWRETNLVFTNAEGDILSYRTTKDENKQENAFMTFCKEFSD